MILYILTYSLYVYTAIDFTLKRGITLTFNQIKHLLFWPIIAILWWEIAV